MSPLAHIRSGFPMWSMQNVNSLADCHFDPRATRMRWILKTNQTVDDSIACHLNTVQTPHPHSLPTFICLLHFKPCSCASCGLNLGPPIPTPPANSTMLPRDGRGLRFVGRTSKPLNGSASSVKHMAPLPRLHVETTGTNLQLLASGWHCLTLHRKRSTGTQLW
jgi:hypothetical protein